MSINQSTKMLAAQQNVDMEKKVSQHIYRLHFSKERLLQYRQDQLRKLLRYVNKHSPWYQRQLAGIDLDHFTESQLPQLPILDKATLMDHWDEIVTVPGLCLSRAESHIEAMNQNPDLLYLDQRYHVLATSGTSGQRGVFVYDWEEWNTYYTMYRRYGLRQSYHSMIPLNAADQIVVGVVAASDAVHGMYALARTYAPRNTQTYHYPVTLTIADIVAGLNQIQPHVVQGCPTSIYRLCEEVRHARLQISPRVISLGGESLYPLIRSAIKSVWPEAYIFNTLGTSEGMAGVGCVGDSEAMHLNDDLCIIEPVDASGHRTPVGEWSTKVYMTNLFNYTLPLIRYEIGDSLCFIEQSCACGVAHQLIKEPQGCPAFDFIYHDKYPVHHVVFAGSMLHDRYIREYQIIQTPNGADIKIQTTGAVDIDGVRHMICQKLMALGISNPELNFIEVDHFDYLISGKLNRFIALNSSNKAAFVS